jgi:hypothetical protein
MTESQLEQGVLVALLDRFEKFRVPRLLDIKEKVDSGALLDDTDIAFLQEVLVGAEEAKPYVDRHPDMQVLYTRALSLYQQITSKALENEQAG